MKEIGIDNIFHSQISEMEQGLNEQEEVFPTRSSVNLLNLSLFLQLFFECVQLTTVGDDFQLTVGQF